MVFGEKVRERCVFTFDKGQNAYNTPSKHDVGGNSLLFQLLTGGLKRPRHGSSRDNTARQARPGLPQGTVEGQLLFHGFSVKLEASGRGPRPRR